MMSGTLLHMPIISFPTFMIFSLTLFSYPPYVIFENKVQDSFFHRPSNSKDLVLFPINETSAFRVLVLMPQELSWRRKKMAVGTCRNSTYEWDPPEER